MIHPKPGLVSPLGKGSHDDMDCATFIRSLFSLRHYFGSIAQVGARGARFGTLKDYGLAAERRMLRVTGGINTHRGAIFSLGLLAAAAGWLSGNGLPIEGSALGALVRKQWGQEIADDGGPAASHGQQVIRRYAVSGARAEATHGFPTLFETTVPTFEAGILDGLAEELAATQAFFTTMTRLPDTNLLYRGGLEGLTYAQTAARGFLDSGGVYQRDWHTHALDIHRNFVERSLSPGGCADHLAAAIFVHHLEKSGTGS